jgi:hypothetical protein
MSATPPPDIDSVPERANRLYWESETRVDDVAGQLGISRNALYAAVRPIRAGVMCAGCGGAMEFANRSRRAAGEASCAECGATARVDPGAAPGPAPVAELPAPEKEEGAADRLRRFRGDLAAVPPERAALIGGAAALGVAVGAVAVRAARRRRS